MLSSRIETSSWRPVCDSQASKQSEQPPHTMTNRKDWIQVARLEDLQPDQMLTIKQGRYQLVMGTDPEGDVFALDNRCPHEGYPLASGELKGCELTCVWHNWKFKVTDGSCLLGGEGVRSYPVRIVAGSVEVDFAEPDPATLHAQLKASIAEGLFRYENGRVFRDVARLLEAQYPAERVATDLAAYDALHAEYGATHSLPLVADCTRFLGRYRGTEALYALAPALDLCGETNRRLAPRSTPESMACPVEDLGAELRRAVEDEQLERAEGLLRFAFEAGIARAQIESWLYAALSDHFLSFGHPLIYLVKAQELFERAGDQRAPLILRGQLFGMLHATREDCLPYMAAYAKRLQAIGPELPDLWRSADGHFQIDSIHIRSAVLDGTSNEAFDAVLNALKLGGSVDQLAETLVGAAATRLLRFDVSIDRDVSVAENWLWATHRFTFASAVRNAVRRFRDPLAIRFLFQSVMFTHSGRAMDLAPGMREQWTAEKATVEEIVQAISDQASRKAVNRTVGYIEAGGDVPALKDALTDLCLADGLVRPIVVAHAIKTMVAAFEEFDALAQHPDRIVPLMAAVRFLASPVAERRVHELVGRSLDWVVAGSMPKKLTQ